MSPGYDRPEHVGFERPVGGVSGRRTALPPCRRRVRALDDLQARGRPQRPDFGVEGHRRVHRARGLRQRRAGAGAGDNAKRCDRRRDAPCGATRAQNDVVHDTPELLMVQLTKSNVTSTFLDPVSVVL